MEILRDSETADAESAVEALRGALTAAGIVLPSLGIEPASRPLSLVTLGRVRSDVAVRLAEVIQRGCG